MENKNFEAFFEDVRKAISIMPKRPPIIVKEGKVVGIKLNSAIIEEFTVSKNVKHAAEDYIGYLMGVKVYRDDTISRPIYIVEGDIETNITQNKESKPSEAFECLERIREFLLNRTNTVSFQDLRDAEKALLKAQETEKENEILKEIIRSFFDKGSPLHQYIDKKFGLTIEVDSDCSIMHLGSFKGVDLDKKLKEVLE